MLKQIREPDQFRVPDQSLKLKQVKKKQVAPFDEAGPLAMSNTLSKPLLPPINEASSKYYAPAPALAPAPAPAPIPTPTHEEKLKVKLKELLFPNEMFIGTENARACLHTNYNSFKILLDNNSTSDLSKKTTAKFDKNDFRELCGLERIPEKCSIM